MVGIVVVTAAGMAAAAMMVVVVVVLVVVEVAAFAAAMVCATGTLAPCKGMLQGGMLQGMPCRGDAGG